jgi:hypothetical protein
MAGGSCDVGPGVERGTEGFDAVGVGDPAVDGRDDDRERTVDGDPSLAPGDDWRSLDR